MKHYITGVVAALSMTAMVHATTINFNNVPNGTLASLAGSVPGVLDFQAYHGIETLDDLGGFIVWTAARVNNGLVESLPGFLGVDHPEIRYHSLMLGRFLQPVENVSLDIFTYLPGGLTWTARDGVGNLFIDNISTQSDVTADIIPEAFSLTVPAGFHVTAFRLTNRDDIFNLDGASWLGAIRFNLAGQSVPDVGSTAALLAAALCGMLLVRKRLIA